MMDVAAKNLNSAKEIYLAASRLSNSAERARFLDDVCQSNAELRQRIEHMLAAEAIAITSPLDRMGAMLHPADMHTRSSAAPLVDIEDHPLIGPYQLMEKIGEGGMGVVYVARQQKPIRRTVALKLIKPGMDSKQVVARFEAERQTLAMMNHSNIAKVLDAGTTESGLPYFVMELVKGTPITDYCDAHKLDLKQRLELFIKVCEAVQHAHQKGIIHRDLKPSNVLVELEDVRSVPKVIDFGVAKATQQPLVENAVYTGLSQMIGTPLYMSPEQAEYNSLDVDTRSDVYSLGVILYELITGSTPFDREIFKRVGFDEMRRIIREDEPARPSSRVSTLQDKLSTTVCDQRQTNFKQLSRTLKGELDWIVLKALEKDRIRRYQSASDFSDDIRRFLSDEPVKACPPTLSYRFRKYVKRHRTNMSWGLAGVVVLAVGGTLLGYSSYQEGARNDKVRERVELALREVETAIAAGDLALAQKPMAEAAALVSQNQLSASAFAARVDELSAELKDRRNDQARYEGLLASARDAQDRMTYDKELSGDMAAEGTLSPFGVLDQDNWLQNLESSSLSVAQKSRARETIYETLLCLADHGPRWVRTDESARKSLELLQRAEQFHTPTKAFYWVGSECHRVLQETDACDRELVQYNATPATIAPDYYLPGHTAGWRGDRKAAMQAYRAALRIQPDHYNSLFFLAHRMASEEHFAEAIAYFTGCIALRPSHLFAFLNRAEAYEKSGDKDSAELDFRTATEVSTIPNEYIGAFDALLGFYRRSGEHEKHSESLARLRSKSERVIAEQSTNARPDALHTWELLTQLGEALCRAGDFDDGIPLLEQALSCARRHFGNVHEKTLHSMNALGVRLVDSNRAAESVPLLEEELAGSRQLRGVEHKETLKGTLNLGWAYLGAARFTDGADLFEKLLQTQTRLHGAEHPDTLASMNNLAKAYQAAGKLDLALPLFEETLKVRRTKLGPERLETLASMNDLAIAYQNAGKLDLALPLFEESLKLWTAMLGAEHADSLASMHNLASLYLSAGKLDLALPLFEETLNLMKAKLGLDHPSTLACMGNLASAYQAASKLDLAVPLSEETLKLRKAKLGPESLETIASMHNLAKAYLDAGKLDLALPLEEETFELRKVKLGPDHPSTLVTMGNLAMAYKAAGKFDLALPIVRELVTISRKVYPKDSLQRAQSLSIAGSILLPHRSFPEAEATLRECLTIREKTQPDMWNTFNAQSLLGGALLGQKKFTDAEPLLVKGYEGLKARERTIPPQGSTRIPEALERLVEFYTNWHAAEPDKGYDTKAAEWQKKLDEHKAASNTEPLL